MNCTYERERETERETERKLKSGEKKKRKTRKFPEIGKNPRDTAALIVVTHHQCPSTVCAVLIFERGGGGGGGGRCEEGPDLGDITIADECLSRSRSGPFPPLGGGLPLTDGRGGCNEDIKGEAL